MNKSRKGSAWEREFCKKLSLWYSGGESDSVFWRTPGSGARATTRTKKGTATVNHYGDIMAVEESGRQFLKIFTIECKRGYSKDSIQDLIDNKNEGRYKQWIDKISKESKEANSTTWMLIVKRNRRDPIVILEKIYPLFYLSSFTNQISINDNLIVVTLDEFFQADANYFFKLFEKE